MNTDRIAFTEPAKDWNEALPIGNGRMGAMVYGGVYTDVLQMNNDSIWFGKPKNRVNPSAKENLPKIRKLIDEGKISEAEDLCALALSGMPDTMSHYEPLGNLYILLDIDPSTAVEDYGRELDLKNAVCRSSFTAGDVRYEREVIASFPDNVIAYSIKADKAGRISFRTQLSRGNITWDMRSFREQVYRNPGYNSRVGECMNIASDMTLMTGDTGVEFSCCVKVITKGGTVTSIGNTLIVDGADEALILIASDTSFYSADHRANVIDIVSKAADRSFDEIMADHVTDHGALYDRVSLTLPEDQSDIVRLFNFGRYLMIAGSREGSQPLNLQGIWNKDFDPMWGSKYTININAQMNYWPSEICGLSECHMPLFDLIERMKPNGMKVASEMYGCRGFVAHHNTDLYGDCAPQDTCLSSSYWVMGAAWLCLHIWEHYLYTNDKEFLRGHIDTMLEAARFLLDFMVEEEDGSIIFYPSLSPENTYRLPGGNGGSVCKGASMDDQIASEFFGCCISAMRALDMEDDRLYEEIESALGKIPPIAVTSDGRIREWREEYEETEPGHRHISHLFALFPGHGITSADPDLMDAARKTLSERLKYGGGHTGWSRAWIINMYAASGDGDQALMHINELMEHSLLPNLFDDHPPFQIDGNFGVVSGIAHMLLQEDQSGEPRFLPALPKVWHTGNIRGLRTYGGKIVDISWTDGKITDAKVAPLSR
ncbi:alpha-L-fucosidase 2 [Ruminococcaceae bacterium KH2T8]|nr:alpha-L-fucosidase 2 [Ruminococcaceae bacterium KH2T8]